MNEATLVPGKWEPVELIIPERNTLIEETVKSLEANFLPLFTKAADLVRQAALVKITDATQKGQMDTAATLLKQFQGVRKEVADAHRDMKAEGLKKGRLIDSVKNLFLDRVGPVEDYLQQQRDFIKNAEIKRLNELRETRLKELGAFSEHVALPTTDVAMLSEADYELLYSGSKVRFTEEKTRLANERAALMKKQREEAEALRKSQEEAAAAKQQLELERAQREQQNAEQRKEQDAKDAETRRQMEEQQRQLKEAQDKAETERKERERIEQQAEAQRRAAALAAMNQNMTFVPGPEPATAPIGNFPRPAFLDAGSPTLTDRQRGQGVAQALDAFIDQLPEFESTEGRAMIIKFAAHLQQAMGWLVKNSDTLKN